MRFRVLLSCASASVYVDLFEPGVYELDEAQHRARTIEAASPGVRALVVPEGADAGQILRDLERDEVTA